MCKCTQGQNISFYLSIRKPQRPGKPYFPGLWGMCAKNFCFSHTGKSQESMKYFFLAFHAFPGFLGIEFCAFQETVEAWKAGSRFQAFHAFLNIRKSQESVEYLFLAPHAFPDFSGWYSMLSKKPWSPGKPGKLGIIPGFPRFFAHREKPGKRGIFIPGFPCFSRLFRLVSHAFQETAESWKAGNHSWLSALFCT